MPFPKLSPKEFTFRRTPSWGDVYWHDFGPPTSRQLTMAYQHPVVIISEASLLLPGTCIFVPMTGAENKRADYEFHVPISKKDCPQLDKDSAVKVDQIFTIECRRLPDQYYISKLNVEVMKRIYEKLLKAIGFPRLI